MFRTAAVLVFLLGATVARAQEESDEALFKKGWAAQEEKKDWAAAAEIYEEVLKRHHAGRAIFARALYERGVCLAKLGKAEEADDCFSNVLTDFASVSEWPQKAFNARADLRPARTDKALLDLLKSQRVSVSFRDTDLFEAFAFFAEVSDLGFQVEGDEWIRLDFEKVSLTASDTPILDILTVFARQVGLAWTIQGGRVVFLGAGELNGRKQPVVEATPEEQKSLQARIDGAKVTLKAGEERITAILDYVRMATQLSIAPGAKLMTDSAWKFKFAAADWKDTPFKEAVASLGLKFEVVGNVIVVDP